MALARITARAHAVAGAMTIGSALAQATAQATSSNTPYGEQYLADVAPYNAASRNFGPRHPTVVFLFSVVQDGHSLSSMHRRTSTRSSSFNIGRQGSISTSTVWSEPLTSKSGYLRMPERRLDRRI